MEKQVFDKKNNLQLQLGTSPVTSLSVVSGLRRNIINTHLGTKKGKAWINIDFFHSPDSISSTETNPLWNWAILF